MDSVVEPRTRGDGPGTPADATDYGHLRRRRSESPVRPSWRRDARRSSEASPEEGGYESRARRRAYSPPVVSRGSAPRYSEAMREEQHRMREEQSMRDEQLYRDYVSSARQQLREAMSARSEYDERARFRSPPLAYRGARARSMPQRMEYTSRRDWDDLDARSTASRPDPDPRAYVFDDPLATRRRQTLYELDSRAALDDTDGISAAAYSAESSVSSDDEEAQDYVQVPETTFTTEEISKANELVKTGITAARSRYSAWGRAAAMPRDYMKARLRRRPRAPGPAAETRQDTMLDKLKAASHEWKRPKWNLPDGTTTELLHIHSAEFQVDKSGKAHIVLACPRGPLNPRQELGDEGARVQMRWMHIQNANPTIGVLSKIILNCPFISIGIQTAALGLLDELSRERREYNDYGVVVRSQKTRGSDEEMVLFMSMLHVTLRAKAEDAPRGRKGTRSLLEFFYSDNIDSDRESKQVVRKMNVGASNESLHVSPLWSMLLGNDLLVTFSSLPLAEACGDLIEIDNPSRRGFYTVPVEYRPGLFHNIIIEPDCSYVNFLRQVAALWAGEGTETAGFELYMDGDINPVTASQWLQLLASEKVETKTIRLIPAVSIPSPSYGIRPRRRDTSNYSEIYSAHYGDRRFEERYESHLEPRRRSSSREEDSGWGSRRQSGRFSGTATYISTSTSVGADLNNAYGRWIHERLLTAPPTLQEAVSGEGKPGNNEASTSRLGSGSTAPTTRRGPLFARHPASVIEKDDDGIRVYPMFAAPVESVSNPRVILRATSSSRDDGFRFPNSTNVTERIIRQADADTSRVYAEPDFDVEFGRVRERERVVRRTRSRSPVIIRHRVVTADSEEESPEPHWRRDGRRRNEARRTDSSDSSPDRSRRYRRWSDSDESPDRRRVRRRSSSSSTPLEEETASKGRARARDSPVRRRVRFDQREYTRTRSASSRSPSPPPPPPRETKHYPLETIGIAAIPFFTWRLRSSKEQMTTEETDAALYRILGKINKSLLRDGPGRLYHKAYKCTMEDVLDRYSEAIHQGPWVPGDPNPIPDPTLGDEKGMPRPEESETSVPKSKSGSGGKEKAKLSLSTIASNFGDEMFSAFLKPSIGNSGTRGSPSSKLPGARQASVADGGVEGGGGDDNALVVNTCKLTHFDNLAVKQFIEQSQALLWAFLPKQGSSQIHQVCERFWGAVDQIVRQVTWSLSCDIAAQKWMVRDFSSSSSLAGDAIKSKFDDCRSCRGGELYSDASAALRHLLGEHVRTGDKFDSPGEDPNFAWIKQTEARTSPRPWEYSVFRVHLERFTEQLQLTCRMTNELQSLVATLQPPEQGASDRPLLPRNIVYAFEEMLTAYLLTAKGFSEWAKRNSIEDYRSPEYQRCNETSRELRLEATDRVNTALDLLERAKQDVILAGSASRDTDALGVHVIRPEFLVAALSAVAQDRPVDAAARTPVVDLYGEYVAKLRYQASRRPQRRVFLDVHNLEEELEALRKVVLAQRGQLEWYADATAAPVVTGSPFRREHPLPEFQQLHRRFVFGQARRLEDRAADLARLQERCRGLKGQVKQTLEIMEEDHGKAIRVFTIVTLFFLPLSFVTGFMGMNTTDIRDMEDDQKLFWKIAVPVTVAVLTLAFVYGYKGDAIDDWFSNILHGQRKPPSSRRPRSTSSIDMSNSPGLGARSLDGGARQNSQVWEGYARRKGTKASPPARRSTSDSDFANV